MLRVFEAFSGVGSQRMALRNLGIEHEVVAIAEIDRFAIASYEVIHGRTVNLGDISQIATEDIPDHDLFTYSFPCQDISIAGKQGGLDEGSGTRSGLLWECQKVISVKKPKYLLLENVKNLVGKKHKENFDKWLQWLEQQGYSNYWQVLNAKDYGIPQNRERVFVVSVLGDHEPYVFPDKKKLQLRLKNVLESEVDERFYLDDKKTKSLVATNTSVKGEKNGELHVVGKIEPNFNQSGCVYSIESLSPTLRAYAGGNLEPKVLIKNATKQGCLEAVIEQPPFRIRKLTPLECWRLMGFTDTDFLLAQSVNSNSQLYKQAGNSIVVPVLEAIFAQLFIKEGSHES